MRIRQGSKRSEEDADDELLENDEVEREERIEKAVSKFFLF